MADRVVEVETDRGCCGDVPCRVDERRCGKDGGDVEKSGD